MKTQHIGIVVFLVALTTTGCYLDDVFDCERGHGDIVTETLDIAFFDRIRLDIPATVHLSQGDYSEVIVEGKRNVIDEIERDVHNGEWDIEFDRCMRNVGSLDIYITMPAIKRIIVQSSGEVYGQNTIVETQLDLIIRGSGMMDLALDVEYLDSRISGSGAFYLEGEAHNHDFEISGSGDLLGFTLTTDATDVRLTGSGDAQVYAEEYLKVRILSSGDVYYKGEPELNISISGSGNVFDAN